jgi:glucose-1-phosphate thymidylyltransferase
VETSPFVQILEQRQGLRIACPNEIAYISLQQFEKIAEMSAKSGYGEYLRSAARSFAR